MWNLTAAENMVDHLETEKATLDGECNELADDLRRAVDLLDRCLFYLAPDRLDPVAADVKKFLKTYAACRPEPEKMCATRFDYILAEYR